ncbi:MAG: hypothetical protein Edafosvirus34_7 [Edafosvirus sp.]|uniref:Uncharacterized protein n=1 Tax=Edafosvirus sp. TaxID=2487765 RepID=A0A3G4ZV69_9VIRU|nr:MAG: hypothetical protein Edafosvirus34_7 [Edafosvirus sp.]
MIRVGTRIYNKNGTFTDPSFPDFTPIVCLTKSTEYGDLGPYCLKDDKGRYMENIYQFARLYEEIAETTIRYSRYSQLITWTHPKEIHVKDKKITEEYWKWREKGMKNKYPIRYPAGFNGKNKGMCALKENDDGTYDILDYIESRKQLYAATYCPLVESLPKFKDLKKRLKKGENLLIIEVDGPHQESLDYYKIKYNVGNNFIENNTILINKENIQIMLCDDKHSFGHGYCLASSLLGKSNEWIMKCGNELIKTVQKVAINDKKNKKYYTIIKNAIGYCICSRDVSIHDYEFTNSYAKIPLETITLETINEALNYKKEAKNKK